MFKNKRTIIIWAAVSLLFCFLCIGFATVNDQLNIFGNIFLDFGKTAVLAPGGSFNAKINQYDVQRIVFDRYSNYSALLESMGMEWSNGEDVQSEESPKDSIKLFYIDATKTAYVLSSSDTDLIANPDCSGMFSPAENSESGIKQIYFNSFNNMFI